MTDVSKITVSWRWWWRSYQYLCVALGFIVSPFASKESMSRLADWFYRDNVLDCAMIISAS